MCEKRLGWQQGSSRGVERCEAIFLEPAALSCIRSFCPTLAARPALPSGVTFPALCEEQSGSGRDEDLDHPTSRQDPTHKCSFMVALGVTLTTQRTHLNLSACLEISRCIYVAVIFIIGVGWDAFVYLAAAKAHCGALIGLNLGKDHLAQRFAHPARGEFVKYCL